MGFKKGNTYSSGRPKGSKNKRITPASIYKEIVEQSLKDLHKDFHGMSVSERLENLERLAKLENEFIAKQN